MVAWVGGKMVAPKTLFFEQTCTQNSAFGFRLPLENHLKAHKEISWLLFSAAIFYRLCCQLVQRDLLTNRLKKKA